MKVWTWAAQLVVSMVAQKVQLWAASMVAMLAASKVDYLVDVWAEHLDGLSAVERVANLEKSRAAPKVGW